MRHNTGILFLADALAAQPFAACFLALSLIHLLIAAFHIWNKNTTSEGGCC
jgi:hypothetical protein